VEQGVAHRPALPPDYGTPRVPRAPILVRCFLPRQRRDHHQAAERRLGSVIRDIPEDDLPEYLGYTAGSTLVFPGNRIGRKPTINGARGLHPRIADRFDLTLECIRRHYLGEPSPLADVLLRYAEFFALFGDFAGYVKFFLLEDLVEDDGQTIRFFHPFADFSTPAVPKDRDEYLEYLRLSNAFISARNRRIDEELQGRIAR
jgi:hypothetical protein